MEFDTIVKVRVALKRLMEKLEKIDNTNEKDLVETVEEWHKRTEHLVHLLNLKKVELRKEEIQRIK
jgi:hypothetical protein